MRIVRVGHSPLERGIPFEVLAEGALPQVIGVHERSGTRPLVEILGFVTFNKISWDPPGRSQIRVLIPEFDSSGVSS